MILGIGIDTVQIKRFAHWHTFSSAQLQRVFSIAEIGYCLESQAHSAARFAVRFAAREAFFKALQGAHPESTLRFLTVCSAVSIVRNSRGLPQLNVNWKQLSFKNAEIQPLTSHVSLSHSRDMATAIAILEEAALPK